MSFIQKIKINCCYWVLSALAFLDAFPLTASVLAVFSLASCLKTSDAKNAWATSNGLKASYSPRWVLIY